MSDTPDTPGAPDSPNMPPNTPPSAGAKSTAPSVKEQNLERMEAILKQSANGIHVLFDNQSIAAALAPQIDNSDFFDFNKMKRVQDVMTALIEKKTYFEKLAFLRELDQESYHMLIRTYFHIVENTVRANTDHQH